MVNKKKTNKISAASIISIILCLLLLPMLVTNVILIVKGLANDKEVPTVGGVAPMIVLSDSMYPQIKSGDLIIVKSADPENIKVGDPIAFFDPDSKSNSVVIHRVIEITEKNGELAFKTKGDANAVEDQSLVPAKNLVGIWTGTVLPGVGNVALFMKSVPGLILCIGVPIVLLVGFELIRQRKFETKRSSETKELMEELEELRRLKAQQDAKLGGNTSDSSPDATVGVE